MSDGEDLSIQALGARAAQPPATGRTERPAGRMPPYAIASYLVLGYLLGLVCYQHIVRPYKNVWPSDYYLVLLLAMTPSALYLLGGLGLARLIRSVRRYSKIMVVFLLWSGCIGSASVMYVNSRFGHRLIISQPESFAAFWILIWSAAMFLTAMLAVNLARWARQTAARPTARVAAASPTIGTIGTESMAIDVDYLPRPLMVLKTIEDFVLATILLIMLAPMMLFIALAIRIDTPGPVFFKQKRHGFRNSEIYVFKFRSMRTDLLDFDCNQQTQRSDMRITRVGRFLRRSSLDELPQLLNVIRGEMSIVGPRPHAVNMRIGDRLCHEIIPHYGVRHYVKPGITGWAQVNGHRSAMYSEEQLHRRVEHDIDYIRNYSVLFDLYILVRTVSHVASSENAF